MGDFSKIYEYVTHTPENINPAVLKSLIEVEYTKPASGLPTPKTLSFNVSTQEELPSTPVVGGSLITISDNHIISMPSLFEATHYIPLHGFTYRFYVNIAADNDVYNVICNGNVIPFNVYQGHYTCEVTNADYESMPDITITVTDKTP